MTNRYFSALEHADLKILKPSKVLSLVGMISLSKMTSMILIFIFFGLVRIHQETVCSLLISIFANRIRMNTSKVTRRIIFISNNLEYQPYPLFLLFLCLYRQSDFVLLEWPSQLSVSPENFEDILNR